MPKDIITNELIIKTCETLSNRVGLNNLSLKMIAEELNIKPPSLYNHFTSLKEIKNELMIYGWKQLENEMINATIGVSGYDALKSMCNAFYYYTTSNKGVFEAMLWYNKYDNEKTRSATKRLYEVMLKVADSLNISEETTRHVIRTIRSFLEGFALLVNNNSFGNPISIKKSFDISLEIIVNGIKSLENKKERKEERFKQTELRVF